LAGFIDLDLPPPPRRVTEDPPPLEAPSRERRPMRRRPRKDRTASYGLIAGGVVLGAGALVVGLVLALSTGKPADTKVAQKPAPVEPPTKAPPPPILPPKSLPKGLPPKGDPGEEPLLPLPRLNPPKRDGDVYAVVATAVRDGRTKKGENVGIGGSPGFVEEREGLLVGLKVGLGDFFGNAVIHSIRPVYETAAGKRVEGTQRGKASGQVIELMAKPGHAIGAVTVKGGAGVDSLMVTYMAIKGGALDPTTAEESNLIGGRGGDRRITTGGDGTPLVGVFGKVEAGKNTLHALGFVTVER
jgi:hypothetical protein